MCSHPVAARLCCPFARARCPPPTARPLTAHGSTLHPPPLQDFSKRTEIRGFRKGSKIPTNVVVNFVGAEAIKSKALQDISDKAIARAVATAGVKLVGQPQFTNGEDALIGEYNPGEPLDIPVVCDIWPELTWLNEEGPYEGIVAEVTNNQQPPTNNRQPPANNQQPTTNNQQPTTNNQQPTTNNQQPTPNNQHPIPNAFYFHSQPI